LDSNLEQFEIEEKLVCEFSFSRHYYTWDLDEKEEDIKL